MSSASLQIRHYRNLKSISLRDLSALSGISPSQLSKIEFGKAKLTVETALKLAGILHVPAAMFLAEPTPQAKARRSITRRNTGTVHENPGMQLEILCSEFKEKQNLFGRSTSLRDHSRRTADGDNILARNSCTFSRASLNYTVCTTIQSFYSKVIAYYSTQISRTRMLGSMGVQT